jgi:hypothetical protein
VIEVVEKGQKEFAAEKASLQNRAKDKKGDIAGLAVSNMQLGELRELLQIHVDLSTKASKILLDKNAHIANKVIELEQTIITGKAYDGNKVASSKMIKEMKAVFDQFPDGNGNLNHMDQVRVRLVLIFLAIFKVSNSDLNLLKGLLKKSDKSLRIVNNFYNMFFASEQKPKKDPERRVDEMTA